MKVNAFQYFATLISAFLLVVNVGCSRKSAPAKVTFQFANKVASQSSYNYQTIIVNITGPGVDPLAEEFDCHSGGCDTIEVEVLSGDNRLIQVLAVVEDGGITEIFYGDITTKLTPGGNLIYVPAEFIASFAREAFIQGRYIPSVGHPMAGKYLTGEVTMRVNVGAGRPPMKIQKFEIFGGWFSSFLLDSTEFGFEYEFTGHDQTGNFYGLSSDPTVITHEIMNDLHDGTGLKLNSAGVQASGNKIVHFSKTGNYYERGEDDKYSARPFPIRIIGFFGDNSDSKEFCSESYSASESLDGNLKCSQANASFDDCIGEFELGDITVSAAASHFVFGTDHCTPMTIQKHQVEWDEIGERYEFEFLGRFGPFQRANSEGDIADVDDATGRASWVLSDNVYLPDGFQAFAIMDVSTINEDELRTHSDGINCDILPALGFQDLGSIPAGQNYFDIPAAIFAAATPAVVICPKNSAGSYFQSALVFPDDHDDGGGPPAQLAMYKDPTIDGGTDQVHPHVCYPMIVELQDSGGHPTHDQGGGVNVNLNVIGSNEFFATAGDCGAGTPNITNINGLSGHQLVYFKSTASDGSTIGIEAADAAGNLDPGNLSLNMEHTFTLSTVKLVSTPFRETALKAPITETCTEFHIVAFADSGEIMHVPSMTMDFSGGHFYGNDPNCQTSNSPLATSHGIGGGASSHSVFLRNDSPGVGTLSNFIFNCSGVCDLDVQTIEVFNPTFDYIHVEGAPSMALVTNCFPVYRGYQNTSGTIYSYPATIPGAFGDIEVEVLPAHTASGSFHNDPDCTAPGNIGPASVGTHTFDAGSQTPDGLYYKPSNPSSLIRIEVDIDSEIEEYFGDTAS